VEGGGGGGDHDHDADDDDDENQDLTLSCGRGAKPIHRVAEENPPEALEVRTRQGRKPSGAEHPRGNRRCNVLAVLVPKRA
jgi:hypothetical protein